MDGFEDFTDVFTAQAAIVAMFAGVLAGVVLSQPHRPLTTVRAMLQRGFVQAFMVAFIGTLFYSGRMTDAMTGDSGTVGRTVGGWCLFLLFALMTIIGQLADGWWNLRRVSLSVKSGDELEG